MVEGEGEEDPPGGVCDREAVGEALPVPDRELVWVGELVGREVGVGTSTPLGVTSWLLQGETQVKLEGDTVKVLEVVG